MTWRELFFLTAVIAGLQSASAQTTAPAEKPPAAASTNAPDFEKEIKAFEKIDLAHPPSTGSIVFVGSSSIRLWTTVSNDFPGLRVVNRGFGGSDISDSVKYFERIILPHRPRQIVLYAGGNDINRGKSPERVAQDFEAFWNKVEKHLPGTRLIYISIAPNPARWNQIEKTREVNRRVAAFAYSRPRIEFVDISKKMLGDDAQPRAELFVADRLHMNERGYAIWREVLRPHLLSEPSLP